jgi:hypothetical protein
MFSHEPAQFILPSDEKFNGSNWTEFKKTILAAAKSRGVLLYIDGTLPRPSNPLTSTTLTPTSYWGSKTPSEEEWDQRDAYVQGMIVLNVKNPVGHGVKTNGTALETWKSLTDRLDAVTDLGLMDAENRLHTIKYAEGSDLDAHFGCIACWMGEGQQPGWYCDGCPVSYDCVRFHAKIVEHCC